MPTWKGPGGHLLHTHKSRNHPRIIQCLYNIQIKQLLITRGYAKQKALLRVTNLKAWQLPVIPFRANGHLSTWEDIPNCHQIVKDEVQGTSTSLTAGTWNAFPLDWVVLGWDSYQSMVGLSALGP